MPPCPRRSTILTLLLALTASAADYPELARRAWGELQSGRAEQAYEMTRSVYRADPAVAAVHLAAAKRHVHPLRVVPICQELIPLAIRHWSDSNEILRTCGWHLVATRTHQSLAAQAAARLVQADPYDDDARGLRLAVADMRELPRRKWKAPEPAGSVKRRRKRDFQYLWRYLRPEDGVVTVSGGVALLPQDSAVPSQVREGVHARLSLRGHEIVLAGWRGTQQLPGRGSSAPRPSTHQLHGGYRLALWSKTTLQLDSTVIFGEGRDEGALRFRAERYGLGTWSMDPALVWTPWGRHGALRLGWEVEFDGLAVMDLQVEGQAGKGGPRGLAVLGLTRRFGSTSLRIDGQLGQATRPLGDRFLVRDLPGLEGAGGSLKLWGRLSDHFTAGGELGVTRLHPDLGEDGTTAGLVELEIAGRW